MSQKTLTFPLFGGASWSATFDQDRAVSFDLSRVTPAALAHGLSLVNRFCGATPTGYSVGEHSLILLDWVRQCAGRRSKTELLACLVHDAPEALGVADCNGALKKLIAQPTRAFEGVLSEALWHHLTGLSRASWRMVWTPLHGYDQRLGNWEALHFGFPPTEPFVLTESEPVPDLPQRFAPKTVEHLWLHEWERLQ